MKHHLDKDINDFNFVPYAVYFNYSQDQQVGQENNVIHLHQHSIYKASANATDYIRWQSVIAMSLFLVLGPNPKFESPERITFYWFGEMGVFWEWSTP